MAQARLPPGFRFHPTDEELVSYYLKRKVTGKHFRFTAVSEVELYKYAPWDLPEKSCFRTKDLEWYFFCPRDKKYPRGSRANRSTEFGYWKTTGKDRSILNGSRVVGMKKSLIFHTGKPPKGDRTDWVMYEYRLTDEQLAASGVAQDAFVLCKIFKKSGMGPKIGEQYGAPFNEEDWEDDDDLEASMAAFPFLPCQPAVQLTDDNNVTTSLPEHTPRSVPATAITEHVLTRGSITIVEPVPLSESAAPLLEPVPLSESVDIHSAVVPLASESFAINSAVASAAAYNELAEITGPPFSMRQNSTALPSTPETDGIHLDELTNLIIGAPSSLGNFLNQLAPLQLPPAVVANFNEAAGDETNGIYGELADLVDGFLNDGNEVDELNRTMASNNNMAQQSVPEPEHFVELNDILFDRESSFFPDFYNLANSPEMDIDAYFFGGTGPS